MNLRDFKKDVEYFVGEFVDDCTLFIALNPHKDSDKVAEIIDEAVELYNNLKDKANVKPAPAIWGDAGVKKAKKKSRNVRNKAAFSALRKEMFEKTDALYEKLSAIITAKDPE